jgi:hypothetical protein
MNEDTLYNLIGRLWVDLRVAAARIQQLENQIKGMQQGPDPSPPPPDAPGQ